MRSGSLARLGCIGTLMWSGVALAAEPNDGQLPRITVRVVDFAKLAARTLQNTEKYADRVFRTAGVSIRWMTCPPGTVDMSVVDPCHVDLRAAEFWLQIEMRKPPGRSDDMLAFANFEDPQGNGGKTAGVFFPAVQDAASRFHADLFQVLGAAIAHELGHLLLGADGHSRVGLMQPNWGRRQIELVTIEELTFTSEQTARIRAAIATLLAGNPSR